MEADMVGVPRRVWFHRISAVAWLAFGVMAFAFGWATSIALVWAASVYANVKSDWGAAEAADDTDMRDMLENVLARLEKIEGKL